MASETRALQEMGQHVEQLEAENAELRRGLEWALGWMETMDVMPVDEDAPDNSDYEEWAAAKALFQPEEEK